MKKLFAVVGLLSMISMSVWAHDGAHAPAEVAKEKALREKIAVFQKRVEKNATDLNALVQLGTLHERLGRITGEHAQFQLATNCFRSILEMVPDHHSALKGWCRAEMARHHFKEALRIARELSDWHPEEPSSWLLLGDAHLFLGHYTEAASLFDRAHRKDQTLATVTRLAQVREFRGNYQEAKELMTQALGLAKPGEKGKQERAWVLTMLAEMALQTHQVPTAFDDFQKALKEDEGTLYAQWRMAAIYRHQGNLEGARKLLHDLVHVRPKINYLVSYGDIWVDLNRPDRAKYWHDKAVARVREEMAAEDFGHVRELVALWARQGKNLDEALALAKREYETIRQDAEGAEWLGWLNHLNGNTTQALHYMETAYRQGLATPRFMMRAALVHHQAGHHLRAAHLLKLAYHPDAFVSKDLLAKAKSLKEWLDEHPEAIRAEFMTKVASKH